MWIYANPGLDCALRSALRNQAPDHRGPIRLPLTTRPVPSPCLKNLLASSLTQPLPEACPKIKNKLKPRTRQLIQNEVTTLQRDWCPVIHQRQGKAHKWDSPQSSLVLCPSLAVGTSGSRVTWLVINSLFCC